ncbi:MAG: LysR family transcriptional regulator [Oscillospiraceae bacterium]|nr:LysR family transcriptional regulator [Oscillospiraceae bacterium]
MNLAKLEYFLVLSEVESMTKASETLHISESALSKSIDSLEKELGVRLFDRDRRRITLNRCGRLAVSYTREILQKSSDMRVALESLNRIKSTVTVGAPIYALYIPLVTSYNTDFWSSQLVFQNIDDNRSAAVLQEGAADVVITSRPMKSADIHCLLFLRNRSLYHIPKNCSVWGRRTATLADLVGTKCYMMNESFTDSNIFYSSAKEHFSTREQLRALNIQIDYVDLTSMRLLFQTPDHFFMSDTLSLLVLPELQAQDRRRFVYATDRLTTNYYLCIRKDASPAAKSLLDWMLRPDNSLVNTIRSLDEWLDDDSALENGPAVS